MHPDPHETLRGYVRAFETLDPDALVPFYHLPCTFIAPHGATVAADAEAARAIVARLVEHARGQGYHRTEVRDLDVRTLAAGLAWLSGTFVRFDARGEEIGRFGFTYVMLSQEAGYRIVVAMAHDVARGAGG